MADQKAKGRPRKAAQKVEPIKPVEKVTEKIEPVESKVVEAKTKEAPKPQPKKRVRRTQKLHDVYIKGKLRQVNELSYKVLVKDPSLDVTLPEGSDLVEPVAKPCKDC